jgi:3'(2'), 5'-bisphosphate nucleotidase
MNHDELLNLAMTLAAQAGEAILAVRSRGFATSHKADETPVTEADHAAEALITAGLRAATPGIPVVAEEEVAAGRITAPGPRFWLVDPLDGTREFAKGRDDFAVCVGLVENGRAILGAVGAPVAGAVYGGIVGPIAGEGRAWKRTAATTTPIAARAPPQAGIVVVASRHYSDDPRLAPFLEGQKVAEIVNMGSALKFCRVAEGTADLYPRFGRTMEWDTAAAHALLEAAGGTLRRLDGAPLAYGKPGWENPGFVCTGRA